MKTVIMYGAEWCGDCRRSKAFLTEHNVEFEYINLDEYPEKADEAEAISGMKSIPVVVMPDKTFLVEPTDEALEAALKKNNIV